MDDTVRQALEHLTREVHASFGVPSALYRDDTLTPARVSEILKAPVVQAADMQLFQAPLLVQHRFPKGKGRRVRKKWRNDPRNWKPDPKLYLMKTDRPGGHRLVGHPLTMRRLQQTMQWHAERQTGRERSATYGVCAPWRRASPTTTP